MIYLYLKLFSIKNLTIKKILKMEEKILGKKYKYLIMYK